jgi:hypothetical protein
VRRSLLVPLACGVAALASAGAAVLVSLQTQRWDTTALVRMHDELPLSKLAVQDDPSFTLRGNSGFYDGAYFYAIARDPLATGRAHELLEEAPYYWGHPGYGWLAWLASGGGRPGAIPDALLAIGLLAVLAAGAAASFLSRALGWTPWGGLAVALNPGLVFAVAADNSESVGAALLVGGLAALLCGRRRWALALLAALCLVKEPLVLIPPAIAAWEYYRRRQPPWLAAAVIPAVLWWVYLRIQLGAFPFGQGSSRLSPPIVGWVVGLRDAAMQSWNAGVDTAQLGQAAVPLIIVVALAILVAAVRALRLRTPVDPAYLVLAALYGCIVSKGVQYPKDLIRELAIVLTLLPFVFVGRATAEEPLSARTHPRARLLSRRPRGS